MSDPKEARVLAVKLKKQRAREASGVAKGLPEASQMAREPRHLERAARGGVPALNPQVDTVLILLADAFKVAAPEGIGQTIRRAPDPDAILDNEPLWDPSPRRPRRARRPRAPRTTTPRMRTRPTSARTKASSASAALGLVEYVVDVGFC